MEDEPDILERVKKVRSVFNEAWPIFLPIFGVLIILAIIAIPRLQQPAFIASLSGLITVVSTIGLAQRGSR